jgi:signal transduction histidine kinase
VTVFLRKQKQTIHLLIHDNGIGIKPEQINNKKSLGILGMKERALIFGGKLQIEGIEGQGTTVKVEIPVP